MTPQLFRPQDVVRFKTQHLALAPIAGLQMQQPVEVLGESEFALVRCNRAEWGMVERAYVFKDWFSKYYDSNPVFLFRGYDQPIPAEDIPRVLEELGIAGRRLVTALRLLKPGTVLEPAYTARFVLTGAIRTREVGPYRTEYLAMPVDGMTWELEDQDADTIARIVAVISAVESMRGTETLRATLDQFNLAHTPLVSNAFSVHLLLTALAMVFDDDGSDGPALASTMYERALALLRWSSPQPIEPAFESFYRETALPLRHAVHHHALAEGRFDLDEAKQRLQWPLRNGIRLLMRLQLQLTGAEAATPRRALNAALDRFIAGDRSPLDAIIDSQ